MDIVSLETAVKLKEAGFPQPEPVIGQFWYGVDEKLLVITHAVEYTPGFVRLNGLREVWTANGEAFTDGVFAPTAADILRHSLTISLRFSIFGAPILIFSAKTNTKRFEHEIAAEACAAAWLELYDNSESRERFNGVPFGEWFKNNNSAGD